MVTSAYAAVDTLKRLGAEMVDVVLPEIDQFRTAHTVLFLCELYALARKVILQPELLSQVRAGVGLLVCFC